MKAFNEKVQFRLFSMPCCKFQCCWVNPRLPSYCPECGKPAGQLLKREIPLVDSPAWLRVEGDK